VVVQHAAVKKSAAHGSRRSHSVEASPGCRSGGIDGGTVVAADAVAVEDKLMQYKVASEERLEALRREKEAKEVAQMRSPEVNKVSRALAEKVTGGRRLQDRIAGDESSKQAKQAELRKALQQRELAEVKGRPEINEVCMRACVHACVCVCVRACVRVCVCVCMCAR
jgi:hypothetical protein